MVFTHRKYGLTYVQLITWLVVEIAFIGFAYALGCRYGFHDERNFSLIYGRAMMIIPLVLIIPTTIMMLYFSLKERDKTIVQLQSEIAEMKEHGASAPQAEKQASIINFMDDKGELKLSVKSDSIYYLEASDNYIKIYYKGKEEVEHFLLRSSMRKQEELLADRGFVRCHRSYIVNFAKVSLLRKDKDGPYLDLGESGIKEIPISKTYLDKVTQHFTFPKGES